MIYENKKIPEIWTHKPSYLKIIKKIFDTNEEMKQVVLTNQQNNEQRDIYNQKLKENFPLLKKQYISGNKFGYDNDLNTLEKSKRNIINIIKVPKIKSLNEEYKEMIKKQNTKIKMLRPDSIKQNLNNILNYRKNIALRFKYNHVKSKGRFNAQLPKSKSQILNSINKSNSISILNRYNNGRLAETNIENRCINDYEDKFMITGMNNKKYKIADDNSIINERSGSNIYNNYTYNIQNK